MVGRVNLIIDGDRTDLGYRIAEHCSGRGLATAAVRAVCELGARDLGLRLVCAATAAMNPASARVLVRSGFEMVGPADPTELGGKVGHRFERSLDPPLVGPLQRCDGTCCRWRVLPCAHEADRPSRPTRP